jgi:hypothetical protein
MQVLYAVQLGSAEQLEAMEPWVGSHVAPVATYWSKQSLHLVDVTSPGVPQ